MVSGFIYHFWASLAQCFLKILDPDTPSFDLITQWMPLPGRWPGPSALDQVALFAVAVPAPFCYLCPQGGQLGQTDFCAKLRLPLSSPQSALPQRRLHKRVVPREVTGAGCTGKDQGADVVGHTHAGCALCYTFNLHSHSSQQCLHLAI